MSEPKRIFMVLSNKEKAISLISNAIAAYSLYPEKKSLPENQSLIDFILKSIPKEIKSEISMDLIDEVFDYVSKTRVNS
jgi:hypothetical protein